MSASEQSNKIIVHVTEFQNLFENTSTINDTNESNLIQAILVNSVCTISPVTDYEWC